MPDYPNEQIDDHPSSDIGRSLQKSSLFKRRSSAEKFQITKDLINVNLDLNTQNTSDISRKRTVITMDYKKDFIKEEDEPSDFSTIGNCPNHNRVRKTNDRIFNQMKSPKLHEFSRSLCKDNLPSITFPLNPIINIEKSLGSFGYGELTSSLDTNNDYLSPDNLGWMTSTAATPSGRQRKLSMPITGTTSLELPVTSKTRDRSTSPVRRKFSTVSVVVSRKISTTMGWRSPAADEVVPQAKYLCTQYIRSRLKRAGLLNKKLGLQRLRSVANLAGGWEVCEVFPRVSCLGQEMERSHPKLYGSVARQVAVALKSDKVVRHLMLAIASHLLRTDVSWARLISLFAVAASLATDCVRQGHPEFVSGVIDGVGVAIERHSCQWIVNQGGWSGVLVWSQPPAFEPTPLEMLGMVGGAGVLLAVLIGGAITLLGHLIS